MTDPRPPATGRTGGEIGTPGLSGMVKFLALGLAVGVLYVGREVLVPIALAVLLSFLLAPMMRWLRHMRAGRVPAVAITVVVAFLAIFSFAAIIAAEISSLGPELPEYRRNLEAKVRSLPKAVPLGRVSAVLHQLTAELKRSEAPAAAPAAGSAGHEATAAEEAKPLPVEVQQPDLTPLQIAQSVIGPLLQPLATAGLVVVLVIFILLERDELRDRMLRLAGVGDLHRTTATMDDAARRVTRYLLTQLAVNACCGLPIGIGLALIGIPSPALWGLLVVLLRFIPYLGIVIAASFPLALAIAVDPGWTLLGWTALLFVATELVVANLVEPRLYAGSTGLSPVAVIVAAVFWTWLWGPIGLLLSTPLTVCLLVLGRHVPPLRFLDVMLGSEPALTTEETFYQRLLANDPDEAAEQAEEFARERSLDEFFEEVAIPVLIQAQADSDSGTLPPERRATVKDAFAKILESLFDDPTAEADGAAAGAQGGFAVCIAGRNELDEAAAMLLACLLHEAGHSAYVFPPDSPAAVGGHRVAFRDAAVVCVSLVSTSSAARARHLVRRIRRRAPRARLVLGFWGLRAAELPLAEARTLTSADAVATSLADALAEISAGLAPADADAAIGSQGGAAA